MVSYYSFDLKFLGFKMSIHNDWNPTRKHGNRYYVFQDMITYVKLKHNKKKTHKWARDSAVSFLSMLAMIWSKPSVSVVTWCAQNMYWELARCISWQISPIVSVWGGRDWGGQCRHAVRYRFMTAVPAFVSRSGAMGCISDLTTHLSINRRVELLLGLFEWCAKENGNETLTTNTHKKSSYAHFA